MACEVTTEVEEEEKEEKVEEMSKSAVELKEKEALDREMLDLPPLEKSASKAQPKIITPDYYRTEHIGFNSENKRSWIFKCKVDINS